MGTVKASNIPFASHAPAADPLSVTQRVFRKRGEQKYSFELLPAGITLVVDRLRRSSQELWGELSVTVDPKKMPAAKCFKDDVISIADFNFSSERARGTRAKYLERRSGYESLDWEGFMEEFAVRVIDAEREGRPAIILAESELADDDGSNESWEIDGFPLLRELPTILFGDSSSGKSYFLMWLLGRLVQQFGVKVLYADWEFSETEHRKRLQRLFQPMPKGIHYVRCDHPLAHSVDHLSRQLRQYGCTYLACDSIGFAVDGPAESQDAARTYFKALRLLGVGSLNIAHIPKQFDDGREAQIFGSTFFKAGARSAWFIDKAATNPAGELRFGLHHRKTNVGELLPPLGYRLVFDKVTTRVETIDPKTVDELSVQLPALDRIKRQLSDGALTPKTLSEELNLPIGSVRAVLSRHKSQFIKIGQKYGLKEEGMEF